MVEPRVRRQRAGRVNYAEESVHVDEEPVTDTPRSKSVHSASSKGPAKSFPEHDTYSSTASSSASLPTPGQSNATNKLGGDPKPSLANSAEDTAVDLKIPCNWQRPMIPHEDAVGVLDLSSAIMDTSSGDATGIILSDHKRLSTGDYLYILSEPPGEPYYIGRIMEFVMKNSGADKSNPLNYKVRVNWLYRPKDISRKSADSRVLYLTMHCDICPIQSIRGVCTVKHKDHIENFEAYRTQSSCFWFDRLYDRYISRFFEVLPTDKITNLPHNALVALRERFLYIVLEIGKSKELCSKPVACATCERWCSPSDSVQCAICERDYHMLCVEPPLCKKPSRGFGWSCGHCNMLQERKIRENKGIFDESDVEDDDDDGNDKRKISPQETPEPGLSRSRDLEQAFERSAEVIFTDRARQLRQLWPFRYLGMHARVEDALDLDDRLYPRAASRIGARHQATVPDWYDHPVVYYDKPKPDKRKNKKNTAPDDASATALIEEAKEHAWMQPRPPGYLTRGDSSTCTLLWAPPSSSDADEKLEKYLLSTHATAGKLDLRPDSPNFFDACIHSYFLHGYNMEKALEAIRKLTRAGLKEPTLTAAEKIRFEQGVKKYGSELHLVQKEVKTKSPADIVRYYYLWKKTKSGHEIWDNYEGRKNKKGPISVSTTVEESALVDDVADEKDDSAYDLEKSSKMHRTFQCKFCGTESSRIWRRAPGYPTAGTENPIVALCLRCGLLWRKYAVVWESPADVFAKLKNSGTSKRTLEEELLEDSRTIISEREREHSRIKSESSHQSLPSKAVPKPRPQKQESAIDEGIKAEKVKEFIIIEEVDPTDKSKKRKPTGHSSNERGVKSSKAVKTNPDSAEDIVQKKPRPRAKAKIESAKAPAKVASRVVKKSLDEGHGEAIVTKNSTTQVTPTSHKANEPMKSQESLFSKGYDTQEKPTNKREPPGLKKTPDAVIEQATECVKSVSNRDALKSVSLPRDLTNTKESKKPITIIQERLAPALLDKEVKCAVCDQVSSISKIITCLNCAVSVHPKCYGVTQEIPYKWLCDPCSNDLRPTRVTHYSCALCHVREPYFNAKSLQFDPPDPLKPTMDNNWAHVKCAVWTPEITFGDAQSLQPVEGLHRLTRKGRPQSCAICRSSQGVCVTCNVCWRRLHVICANRTEGCRLGFKFTVKDDDRPPTQLLTEFNGEEGWLRPSLVCPLHQSDGPPGNSNLISPWQRDTLSGKTIMEIYIRDYQQSVRSVRGEAKRYLMTRTTYAECLERSPVKSGRRKKPDSEALILHNVESGPEDNTAAAPCCRSCLQVTSSVWWRLGPEEFVCHACHWKEKDPNALGVVTKPFQAGLTKSQGIPKTPDLCDFSIYQAALAKLQGD